MRAQLALPTRPARGVLGQKNRGARVHELTCSRPRASPRCKSAERPATLYSVLGVSPRATQAEIKAAYRGLMQGLHPDRAGEESHALCATLNEVYEILHNPERRLEYDALLGVGPWGSANPFMVSEPRTATFVDEASCIGCLKCAHICSKVFAIEPEYGRARVTDQRGDTEERITEAIDACPVSCIHKVTAAQLPLLEEQMAEMDRPSVDRLQSGSDGPSVFRLASYRWEKRRAMLMEDMAQEQKSPGWGIFGGGAWWQGGVGTRTGARWNPRPRDGSGPGALPPSSKVRDRVSEVSRRATEGWSELRRRHAGRAVRVVQHRLPERC